MSWSWVRSRAATSVPTLMSMSTSWSPTTRTPRAATAGEVAFVSQTGVAYVGGYVDVKLASPRYLRDAADHGDDPTRASFDRGRVTLDRSAISPGS